MVVQYLPDNLKIGVVSLKSQLQLMWWFVVVRGGLILLCHLVLNLIKTSAASSNKFKNKFKNEIFKKKKKRKRKILWTHTFYLNRTYETINIYEQIINN